jgi:TonB family protein
MLALGRAAAFSGCLLLLPCLSGCGAAFAAAAAAAQRLTPEQVAALEAWKRQVVRQLESKKQYPAAALPRREQGTVLILFHLDRRGRLLGSRISKGSGSTTLDNAGLALVHQAQPFPPPPVTETRLTLPINYSVRVAPLPRCTLANRLLGPCTSP